MTSGFWDWPAGQRRHLRSFGIVMAAALAILAGALWHRGGQTGPLVLGAVALLFVVAGLGVPAALRVPFGLWMYLARVLGWLNTRVLLALVFYTLFSAIGVTMRLLHRDPLPRRWDRCRASYWQPRDRPVAPRDHYEHQF